MGVILVLAVLLLARPDLGTVVTSTVCHHAGDAVSRRGEGMAVHRHYRDELGGDSVNPRREPYRIRRVTSFWNPREEDPFGSGYQLTQSLMAFGRGEIWGQGWGIRCRNWVYRRRTPISSSPLL